MRQSVEDLIYEPHHTILGQLPHIKGYFSTNSFPVSRGYLWKDYVSISDPYERVCKLKALRQTKSSLTPAISVKSLCSKLLRNSRVVFSSFDSLAKILFMKRSKKWIQI